MHFCSARLDTLEILHTPTESDEGLHLLLHSCCDTGLLYWQPVDFSDCETTEDREGTRAMKIAHARQRGLRAVPAALGLVSHRWRTGSG